MLFPTYLSMLRLLGRDHYLGRLTVHCIGSCHPKGVGRNVGNSLRSFFGCVYESMFGNEVYVDDSEDEPVVVPWLVAGGGGAGLSVRSLDSAILGLAGNGFTYVVPSKTVLTLSHQRGTVLKAYAKANLGGDISTDPATLFRDRLYLSQGLMPNLPISLVSEITVITQKRPFVGAIDDLNASEGGGLLTMGDEHLQNFNINSISWELIGELRAQLKILQRTRILVVGIGTSR